ncbi:unnamed protein product [Symbiodinium sp. CCMP2592]|nr:unnamed protein product [Symbiodinium sp. CCMP2592]
MNSARVPAGFVPELPPEGATGGDAGDRHSESSASRSRSPRRRGVDSSPKVNSFSQREAQRRTNLRQRTSNTGDRTPRKSALRRRHSEAPHTTGPGSSTEIGLHTVAVKLDGFHQTPMDGLYRRRDTVVIADHPTFFHTQGDNMFLYKNKSERWAISPTSLRNEDLVEAAKQGEQQGLACQKATGSRMDGTWIEFLNKRWVDVKLSVRTFNFEEYERHALGRHKRAAPLPHQPKVSFPNGPGVTRPRVQPLPPRPATVQEPELTPEQLLWQIQQEVRREDRDEKRRREQARQKATSPAMSTAGLHEQVFGAAAETALPSSSASAAAAAKASALLTAASVMPPPVEASPLLAAASTMATPPKMVPEDSTLLSVLTSQSTPPPPPQDTSRVSSSLASKPEASGATEALPTPMPSVALQPPIVTEAQPLKPTQEDNPVPASAPAQQEVPNVPKTPPKAKPSFPKRWSYPGDDNVDSFLEKLRGKAPKQAADKDQQWQDSRNSRQDDEQEWDWSSQTWWDEWNDESWKRHERWSAKDTGDKQWFEPKDSWWTWEDRGSASWSQTWNKQSWKSEEDDESWGRWKSLEHGSGKGGGWTEAEQAEDKKPKDSKDGKEKAKEKKDKKEDKKDKKERKEKHKDKKDKDKKDKEGPEATSVVAKGSKAPEPEEVAQKGDVPQPGPALQVDFGFPATVDGFFLFMRERERIRLRRESSQPYPWTDDRVLRHLRVRPRPVEHDRTSMLIRRLLLPLDDKWHSSTSRQQKCAVVREYVLSLGLWRRFGSVNFINRAGIVAGDATPEELSAKAVSVALDLWKNGFHSCSDAYGPASRAHAAELYAWLGEEASRWVKEAGLDRRKAELSRARRDYAQHFLVMSLVTDAGLVIVSSGFLQVLNENGKAFRSSASQWAKYRDSPGQANSEVFLKRLTRWQTSLWIKGPCDSHSWCSFWEPLMAMGSVKASTQQRSFETFCRHPSSVVVVSISIAGHLWIGQPDVALTAWLSGLERQRCPTKCSWRSCSRSMAAGTSYGPQASKTCPALTCNWGTCAPSWPSSNATRGQRTAVPPGCLSWSAARHLAAPSTVSLDTRPSKARDQLVRTCTIVN